MPVLPWSLRRTLTFKLQCLQSGVLRATGITHGFQNSVTKLCRTHAEEILNHRNAILRGIGQEEAMHRKYKKLKLGGGQAYDHSDD
jgi:hypothetical protein